jgi:TetR/AcrR family transcriptional regulator, repressor for uid operon
MENERSFIYGERMPKLSDVQQEERRARILDAAERSFARSGFHRATMQDICKEAGVSPGALYIWFESKEALIAGIAARNRDEVLASFAALADAEDFAAGMAQVLEACILNQPMDKSVLCLEIGAEATRNPAVAETLTRFDETVCAALTELLDKAEREGRIKPSMPTNDLAQAMHVIADGLFWRRAVQPDFDARSAGRVLLTLVGAALSEPSK